MARVQVETYGCAMNQADSEIIAGLLEEAGHVVAGEGGDVLVVNTCTVKTPTEVKIKRRLRELEKTGRRVVVAGCLPAASPAVADSFPTFSFVGVNVQDVPKAVEVAAAGRRVVLIKKSGEKVCLPKRRLNPFVEIVPIAEGCLGSCSYCITKAARGRLRSFPTEKIVVQVKGAVTAGVREVWLTAQDTGAYGLDLGSSLPELLQAVVAVPGDFKVRVGMMNPNHALGFLDELVEAFHDEKVYRFLHVPVQSGSDRILREMGRGYTADDFRLIAKRFMAPADVQPLGTTISTDVIVGYPTETDQDFKETLKLIEQTKPDIVNISRFWPREGTKAAEEKQCPGSITKQRSRATNRLFEKTGLERNKRWVGWKGKALVSEKNNDGSYTARNQWYKPVIVKSEKEILGKEIKVRISNATHYDLRGVIT